MIKKISLAIALISGAGQICGQTGQVNIIGDAPTFAAQIRRLVSSPDSPSTFILPTPTGTNITCKVNLKRTSNNSFKIVGNGQESGSTFSLAVAANGDINGRYISVNDRKAYEYFTDIAGGNVIAQEVAIDSVLCIDYRPVADIVSHEQPLLLGSSTVPLFESKPGSQNVIYIDVDGEVSTSDWNGGVTINATAFGLTDEQIQTIWEVVAQDYLVFDVNVTTDRSVYDAAAIGKRQMCIVTPTTTANPSPGVAGVAGIGTFYDGNDNPCWVFSAPGNGLLGGNYVSHEVGHTVGLYHDGTSTQAYYGGHNGWSPVMGSGLSAVTQWSSGEYADANNHENDLAKIGTRLGSRPDDIGNTAGTARPLVIEPNGRVLDVVNRGLINSRDDIDVFSFTTTITGNISFTVKPFYNYSNLNIKLRLLNSSGDTIVVSDPAISLSAGLLMTAAPPGTYYLEIDGAAHGADPVVGYSDYASLGDYYITGRIPMSTGVPIAGFTSTALHRCDTTQVTYTDTSLNGATSWSWTFEGGTPALSTAAKPVVSYSSPGMYTARLVVQNSFGLDSVTITNNIWVNHSPAAPVTTGDSRCDPGMVSLSASGNGGALDWYNAPAGGALIHTGTSYLVTLDKTTTFYVSEVGIPVIQKLGAADSTISPGFYYTNTAETRGLYFDVFTPCTLKSVVVYAKVAGTRTIKVLKGMGGATVDSITVLIPAGKNRVELGFILQPGTDYYLTVSGPLVNLFVNLGGTQYPYTIPGLLSITDGMFSNQVYYFYDWEVTEPVCPGSRAAVTGTINPVTSAIWKGTISNDWTNGNNWSCGIVPSAASDVTIPPGTPFSPLIPNGTVATCRSLLIMPGATVTVGQNANLQVLN